MQEHIIARIALLDKELENAQWLYDQNEQERRTRYITNMDYVRDRLERNMTKSTSDYNGAMVMAKYKKAYEYYMTVDNQSMLKNRKAFENRKRFIRKQREKLEEQFQKSPA